MKNFNTYIPTEEFYDSRRNPIKDLDDLNSRHYDSWINHENDAVFNIEVSGASTIELTVQGCINMTDAEEHRLEPEDRKYSNLLVINLTTLNIQEKITQDGLYQVCSSGLPEIKLDITAIEGDVIIVGAGGRATNLPLNIL